MLENTVIPPSTLMREINALIETGASITFSGHQFGEGSPIHPEVRIRKVVAGEQFNLSAIINTEFDVFGAIDRFKAEVPR